MSQVTRTGDSPSVFFLLLRAGVSALTLSAMFPVFAAEPPPATPAAMPKPVVKGPHDTDPGARGLAQRQIFGKFVSEEYKQNFIRELAKKNALYGNQAAGADYPRGMPVWQSIGPRTDKYLFNGVTIDGVDSGRVRTILPDPSDPDKLYLLTSGGGLWKTRNFTAAHPRWEVLTDALVSTSGGSAALGRTSQTIYLGIGDPFDVLSTVAGVVVKSTDGGRTWGPFVNLAGASAVRDVKVDSSGAVDVVLVATDIGLFRSSDGGASFSLSSVGQAENRGSAWNLARTTAGWLLATVDPAFDFGVPGAGALFVSADRGATWSPIPNGSNSFSNVGRATLAVAVPGESVVYAIAADPTGSKQADVFRSQDGGLNWTALGITAKQPQNPNCYQPDMNILADQAWYNQLIVVSPFDRTRRTVHIGGQLSTAKTVDGGANWMLTSNWLPTSCPDGVTPSLPYVHADHHAAVIVSDAGHERIMFGTDGGLFVSTDGGASFDSSKNTGIVSLLSQTIMSTPRREDSAITGLQDTGTRARLRGSSTWNQVLGGDGEGVGWSQANNAVTIATAEFDFIARRPGLPASTGDPNDWLDGTAGLNFDDPDCFPFYTPIATPSARADATGQVFYTVTGSRLYKTTDGAAHWQQVHQFLAPNGPSCVIRLRWHTIGLHPRNQSSIALAGAGGRTLVTTNGGSTWNVRQLIGTVPGWTGFNSAPAWASNGTLYMASESPSPGATRLAKSFDNGTTWLRADNGLPDVAVADIVVDPRDRTGKTVYAATWIGVYSTRDGGANWRLFGAGLPNVYVAGLYLSPDEDFLRIATYGRGVWEIDLDHERDR